MKVSYFKSWGSDGTCYTQAIKVNKKELEEIKKYLNSIKKEELKNTYTRQFFQTLEETETQETGNKKTFFLNLTQLMFIASLLKNKRILHRNTVLIYEG